MSHEKTQTKEPLHTVWNPNKQIWMLRFDMNDPDKLKKLITLPSNIKDIKKNILNHPVYQKYIEDKLENIEAIIGNHKDKVQQKGASYYLSNYGLPIGAFISGVSTGLFNILSITSTQAAKCLESLTGFTPNATALFAKVTSTLMTTYNMTFTQFPSIDPKGPLAQQIYLTIFNETQQLLTQYYEQELQANQTANQQQIGSQFTVRTTYGVMAGISGIIFSAVILAMTIKRNKASADEQSQQDAFEEQKGFLLRLKEVEKEITIKELTLENIEKLFENKINSASNLYLNIRDHLPASTPTEEGVRLVDLSADDDALNPYHLRDYFISALDEMDDLNVYKQVNSTVEKLLKSEKTICTSLLEILKALVFEGFSINRRIIKFFNNRKVWETDNFYSLLLKLSALDNISKKLVYTCLTNGFIHNLKDYDQLEILHKFVKWIKPCQNKLEQKIYYHGIFSLPKEIDSLDPNHIHNISTNLKQLENKDSEKLAQYIGIQLSSCEDNDAVGTCIKQIFKLVENERKLRKILRKTQLNEKPEADEPNRSPSPNV